MISIRTRYRDNTSRVKRKAQSANFESLRHAAAALRITARRKIRRRKRPAPAGSPPHTHTGRLKRAIRYEVDRAADSALIGPAYDVVGLAGAAHEHGGRYRGDRYPARPFMRPALESLRPRLPRHWAARVR